MQQYLPLVGPCQRRPGSAKRVVGLVALRHPRRRRPSRNDDDEPCHRHRRHDDDPRGEEKQVEDEGWQGPTKGKYCCMVFKVFLYVFYYLLRTFI